MAGKGYQKVYNLSGGIKSWEKQVAVGPEETGLQLFDPDTGPREAIVIGFGLEKGLREFYLTMQQRVKRPGTVELFDKLAQIEILHQQQLLSLYNELGGEEITLEEFDQKIAEPAMEGGLTTEEYLQLYQIDINDEIEVLSLALAIEAQALDLYLRAAGNSKEAATQKVLYRIADEERAHIRRLGQYIDNEQELL